MNTIFSFSAGALARPLVIATLAALAILVIQGVRSRHLVRIGLRNVPRRWLRTGLIVFGLMLATTFVASALAVDDTIVLAVKTIAVFNLGSVDEQVDGGYGDLGTYPARAGSIVRQALAGDAQVAGVAPALVVPNVLISDTTARQVRGGVSATALDPTTAGPLADLHAVHGAAATPIDALSPSQIYLNRTLGQLLNAQVGDQVYLYSSEWPGQRFPFTVRGIVTGGALGEAPALVLPLPALQRAASAPDSINRIFIANAGAGLSGVANSNAIARRIRFAVGGRLHVSKVKQDGVRFSLQAQDVFGRILLLYTLFALAIGLLLIFLIFTLLAAERRAELGMARAVGMRRAQVLWVLLFEGSAYDVTAAALGMLAGLLLGIVIVTVVAPTIQRLGFPLRVVVEPRSMLVAFCLGLLFTLGTIALAAAVVTRMTIVAALRDLPEPPAPQPTLAALVRAALRATAQAARRPSEVTGAWLALLWGCVVRGVIPFAVGVLLLRQAVANEDALAFSGSLSLALVGLVLLLRWLGLALVVAAARADERRAAFAAARASALADRATALLIGGGLVLYWSLPFDALAGLGLPRFAGGIELFFVAGTMMVFGAVLALAPNLDLLLLPARWLLATMGRLRHVTAVALIYPAHQRFRTGIGLCLFALVCFTMVLMACIASSTTANYDNLPAQAAGYDIAGQPLFSQVGSVGQVDAALRSAVPGDARALSAVSLAEPLPLAVLQPGTPQTGWSVYPSEQIDGSFLDGVGLPLVARANGLASDAAVWRAVRTQPGAVVIDISALSPADAAALGVKRPATASAEHFFGPPIAAGLSAISALDSPLTSDAANSASGAQAQTLNELGSVAGDPNALREFTLRLRGIVTGAGQIAPTPLWVVDLRGGPATKLTVVGLVENSGGQRYGIFGSAQTFAPVEHGLPPFGNSYYYFKVRPGVDAHMAARAIGSALLDHGFETTVIQDALLDINGPRVFISRVVVGLVGLTLLVGMAALAVTGSRAVVERRQQIGMLRALGFRRFHVQLIFLIEALLVGVCGTALGLALGLALARNIFAVDFFAQFATGLVLVVPWVELGAICGAALLASLLAALVPAWQAGCVAPADALRYE